MDHKKAGRPQGSAFERAVVERLCHERREVLDLKLDGPWLSKLARNVPDAVHQMRKRGTLRTLQRGRYFVPAAGRSPQPARLDYLEPVADAVLRRLGMDYYVSWHSGLWHHGLIDQQARRVYAAVTKRKRPVQMGMGGIRFVTVAERKFFGRELDEGFEWPVWVATVEKSLIDSLDQPRLAAPVPVIAKALERAWVEGLLDPERLVADAIRFDSPNLNRRLGFWMDLFGIPGTDPLALRTGRNYAVPLVPGHEPRPGGRQPVDKRWHVYRDPSVVGTAQELK